MILLMTKTLRSTRFVNYLTLISECFLKNLLVLEFSNILLVLVEGLPVFSTRTHPIARFAWPTVGCNIASGDRNAPLARGYARVAANVIRRSDLRRMERLDDQRKRLKATNYLFYKLLGHKLLN
jgi:hypothetical protein